MKKEELFEKTAAAIAETADIELSEITMESKLMDDLELSSLEVYSAMAKLEETFSVKIPDEKLMEILTVEDLIGEIEQRLNA